MEWLHRLVKPILEHIGIAVYILRNGRVLYIV
nr:MAG TPA: hypothetical protein [Caudoviricetes sp.]